MTYWNHHHKRLKKSKPVLGGSVVREELDPKVHSDYGLVFGMARDYAGRNFSRSETEVLIRQCIPSIKNKNLTPVLDKAFACEQGAIRPLLSERSLARYCLQQAQGNLKVRAENNRFLLWNGKFWEVTSGPERIIPEIMQWLNPLLMGMHAEERSKYTAWLENLDNLRYLLAALRLEADKVTHDDLLGWRPLLHVNNGGYDLDEQRMVTTSRDDYLTDDLQCPVDYRGPQDTPLWSAFLASITDNDEARQRCLHLLGGYILGTEVNYLAYLFLLVNRGGNGGRLFLHTLREILGSYAGLLPGAVLTQPDVDLDWAAFAPKRLLTVEDADLRQPVDSNRLLALASGVPLMGRSAHKDSERAFALNGKIVVISHYLPTWLSQREELANQVLVIPLAASGFEGNRMSQYYTMLAREREGILHWLLDGYRLLHQADGLLPMPSDTSSVAGTCLTVTRA